MYLGKSWNTDVPANTWVKINDGGSAIIQNRGNTPMLIVTSDICPDAADNVSGFKLKADEKLKRCGAVYARACCGHRSTVAYVEQA